MMVTGVPRQTILKNLLSSSCRVRRTGVEQALEYLDTMLLGGDAEEISNCVSVLVAFANSSFGCAGFDPKNRPADKGVLFRRQEWNFTRWKDGHSRHTCRWQPTYRAVQGLMERIVEPAYFSQPEMFDAYLHDMARCPNVYLMPQGGHDSTKAVPCHVSLAFSRLPGLVLDSSVIDSVSFFQSVLEDAKLVRIRGRKTDFTSSYWTRAVITGDFQYSMWIAAYVRSGHFSGNFANVHFDRANLAGSSFAGSDLLCSVFPEAVLIGADLRGCRALATAFDGAVVDDKTQFPDGMSIARDGRAVVEKRWPGIDVVDDPSYYLEEESVSLPPHYRNTLDARGAHCRNVWTVNAYMDGNPFSPPG